MRLDTYLKENLAISRSRASDLIKLQSVKVNGVICKKTSYQVKESDQVEVLETLKYASRSGEKLEEAIVKYALDFSGKTVLDVGSSTGGFTDCSLAFGAKHVYAYDVGNNQMIPRLKEDRRVSVYENTNILNAFPDRVDICLVDVSFTSIKPIVTHLKNHAKLYVLLFKPQFEIGKEHIKKGIIKDEKKVLKMLSEFQIFLQAHSIHTLGYIPVLKGKKGNQEYMFIGVKDAAKAIH